MLCLPALAATAAAVEFTLTPPQADRFVVEHIYNYTTRSYAPQVSVPVVAKADASYASPEDAAVAQFSAMRAGDYDWWMSGWTAESQEQMVARNQAQGRGASFWVEAWKKGLAGAEIKLIERLDTGRFVWIRYEMRQGGKLVLDGMQVFKLTAAQRWQATQELATDYMYHQYQEDRAKTGRVTITVR